MSLADLSIPATHDSATYNTLKSDVYTRTQSMKIERQLEAGIRSFDMRCGHGAEP